MKMTRADFGELMTPIHKKIFFDSYNEVPKKYTKMFRVEKMTGKNQSYPHLGAFGLWKENTEGNDFNLDSFDEGPVASFEARRYDKSYEITWELMQDDRYSVFKGIGKGGSAKGLGRSLRATEETDTAKVILGGFSNTGYDGKSLFAFDHPLINSTKRISNLIVGALTDENLKGALTLMRGQTDEAGTVIAASAKQLLVCPALEFQAKAIVRSILQSGTNFNDVNTIPDIEVVVWDFLTDPTGEMAPWFIQDTTIDNLLFLRREEPWFDSERIQNKVDYRMFGFTRYDCGYCDWRGLVGSKGTKEQIVVPTLGFLDATVIAGSSSTQTKISKVDGAGSGTLKYKTAASLTKPGYMDADSGYTALNLNTDITVTAGHKIVVVESVGGKITKSSDIKDVVVGE